MYGAQETSVLHDGSFWLRRAMRMADYIFEVGVRSVANASEALLEMFRCSSDPDAKPYELTKRTISSSKPTCKILSQQDWRYVHLRELRDDED
jgi:hypothetical protein